MHLEAAAGMQGALTGTRLAKLWHALTGSGLAASRLAAHLRRAQRTVSAQSG